MKIDANRYLDRAVTDSVKGFFILTVFMGHIMTYFDENQDLLVRNIWRGIGGFLAQLIVVMFLFYSGYGVMCSITKKGEQYIKAMPYRRVLNTLLNFMVAVAIFLVLQTIILGKHYDVLHVLKSLVGWESIGISNWYIFMILVFYALTYISFRLIRNHKSAALVLVFLTVVTATVVSLFKPSYWVDTALAYPFGVLWCLYREKIENFVKRYYLVAFSIGLIGFLALSLIPFGRTFILMHNFRSVFFAFLISLLMMVFPLKSNILIWLGKNLFPIYIYQRLAMIYLSEFDGGHFIKVHPYLYFGSCLVITLIIAYLYQFVEIKKFTKLTQLR